MWQNKIHSVHSKRKHITLLTDVFHTNSVLNVKDAISFITIKDIAEIYAAKDIFEIAASVTEQH